MSEPELTEDVAPGATVPAIEQVAAWIERSKARCAAEGSIFDCVFHCVSEGGAWFDIDAEELAQLAAGVRERSEADDEAGK